MVGVRPRRISGGGATTAAPSWVARGRPQRWLRRPADPRVECRLHLRELLLLLLVMQLCKLPLLLLLKLQLCHLLLTLRGVLLVSLLLLEGLQMLLLLLLKGLQPLQLLDLLLLQLLHTPCVRRRLLHTLRRPHIMGPLERDDHVVRHA